jgi:KDO2-lipid IV(A) lauroyltransferase
MIYWLHRMGAPLARWLPIGVSYGIAERFAPVVFLLWREKRNNAVANMTRVLRLEAPNAEAYRIARRTFVNYAKYLVDMLRLTGFDSHAMEQRVTITGWEHFERARQGDNGLIFIAAHLGNSDLAAALLAGRGFPVHVVAEPLEPPKWDALVQAARTAAGLTVIPLGSSALRLLRVLRERGIVAVLIDRPVDEKGVAVEFFGARARVPAGAAALALRCKVPILAAYVVRTGNAYIADISPELSFEPTGDDLRDLEALTQEIFRWLESVIVQYPDQWYMFRPMWEVSALTASSGTPV